MHTIGENRNFFFSEMERTKHWNQLNERFNQEESLSILGNLRMMSQKSDIAEMYNKHCLKFSKLKKVLHFAPIGGKKRLE